MDSPQNMNVKKPSSVFVYSVLCHNFKSGRYGIHNKDVCRGTFVVRPVSFINIHLLYLKEDFKMYLPWLNSLIMNSHLGSHQKVVL